MSVGKKIALGALGLVFLAILFLVLEHFRGTLGLRKWRARLEAEGEVLRIDLLAPERVPAEKNGMPALIWAGSQLRGFPSDHQPPAARYLAPGKVMAITRMESWTNRSGGTRVTNITWDAVADSLKQRQEALESFLEALNGESFRANLDYQRGFSIPLPHLAALKSSAQTLLASASYDLHQGNAEHAARKITYVLKLAREMQSDRLIISELVRIAIARIAFETTWQMVQTDGVGESQLALLQKAWREQEFLVTMENAISMERAIAGVELENFRNSARGLGELWDTGNSRPPRTGPAFVFSVDWFLNAFEETPEFIRDELVTPVWKFAWSHQDELNYCRILQNTLDSHRRGRMKKAMPRPTDDWLHSGDDLFSLIDYAARPANLYDRIRYVFSSMIVASLGKSLSRAWMAETVKELAVTGIALKRFERKHGSLPHSLDALTPEFLKEIPVDFMDGKPLKYRLRADEFILYSVGENGADDGGDASPKTNTRTFNLQNGRDWMWPQAATTAELQAYDQRLRGGTN